MFIDLHICELKVYTTDLIIGAASMTGNYDESIEKFILSYNPCFKKLLQSGFCPYPGYRQN